jgi:internalin A
MLSQLGDDLFGVISLTTLNLSDNLLTTLPPAVSALSNLRTLLLPYNRLASLPDVSTLTALTELDVGHNSTLDVAAMNTGFFSALDNCYSIDSRAAPPCARLLMLRTDMHSLGLSSLSLPQFPIDLCASLPQLTSLNLSHNLLRQLPPEIEQLMNQQLAVLDLSFNALESLPDAFHEAYFLNSFRCFAHAGCWLLLAFYSETNDCH